MKQPTVGQSHGQIDLSKMMHSGHPVAWLSKLTWEIAEAMTCRSPNPAARVYKSMNCAITAWHMHDWIWQFSDEQMKEELAAFLKAPSFKSIGDFSRAIQRLSPAISYCRQIGTAVKHVSLAYNRPEVTTRVLRLDEEDSSGYQVMILDGSKEHLDTDVYTAALDVWSRIYVQLEFDMWEEVYKLWPSWQKEAEG
ncbi:hypothetical protein [Pseudomonas putida]|uniref:hypothetical protein n=1 Tax=Pseudomonas putida TaxID=303 RepID=UPI001183B3FD|nr:hypothetical protein [Pseudomonas putida]HDS1813707.1 hypothetical protein [Pseudomonas putida]HDS3809964.1 hypothetical protein [Pseudomonas putida]